MKLKFKVLLFALLMIPIINVKAASGVIDITASDKNPTVGNIITVVVNCKSSANVGTCEYTINFDRSKLSLVSGEESVVDYAANGSTHSLSKTYKFKAIASGSSSISVKAYGMVDWDENDMSTSVSPVTITGKAATNGGSTPTNNKPNTGNVTYSTDNYLKSLSVDNKTIKPAFNKDTLEYKLVIDAEDESIKINAIANDSKATVKGAGEVNITNDLNKIEIVVTSEKGTTRTYTINLEIKDSNPIEVEIDDVKYNVVKRKSLLSKIEGYEEKNITIDNQEIPALYSDITKLNLVGLRDEKDGSVNLYVYRDKKFYRYNNIIVGDLSLSSYDTGSYGKYKNKVEITINEKKVTIYKDSESSKFGILYAINNKTGNKSWYRYDEQDNTIQRYEEKEATTNYSNTPKIMILILGISTLTFAVLFIISLISLSNKKKKLKELSKKNKK